MSSEPKLRYIISFAIIILTFTQLACGQASVDNRSATVQALVEWLAPTASAVAVNQPESKYALETAAAEATTLALSAGATQTALAAISADQAATATAFAPILSELPKYDVDPLLGSPGWIHPPVTLDLEGFQQYDSNNYFIFTIAEDFVISADITWNTQYGTSGCGFVLRSDGDEEEPNQYMVVATRGGTGHVLFTIMAEGEIVGTKDIFAAWLDPEFDWQNDTTNRLTIVGRGTLFTIYTNDTLIGDIDVTEPPALNFPSQPDMPDDPTDPDEMEKYLQELDDYEKEIAEIQAAFQAQMSASSDTNTVFERGFVAMVALSESGRTICEFDNAWLWLIEDEN